MRSKLFIIWEDRQALKEELYVLLYHTNWELKKLSLQELQAHAKAHETCLLLPVSSCAIHQVHLPKLKAKDLPLAVSAILEDKILGNVSDFYSYIDKVSTEDYLVFLWEKKTLAAIQTFFEKHHIQYTSVTLDWFALKPSEVFLMADGGAFVYSNNVQGYLNKSVFKHWFQNYSFDAMTMYASESYPEMVGVMAVHESFWIWMAKRLSEMPIKDIFAKPKRFDINSFIEPKHLLSYFPKLIWMFFSAVFGIFLIAYASNWFVIKKHQTELQKIISMADGDIEFRLSRYLDKQKQKNQFWSLWMSLQKVKNSTIKIDNIQYQQRKIKINLTAADMQAYQQFQRQLTHAGIHFINAQLQTDESGIHVTIEIQGGINE